MLNIHMLDNVLKLHFHSMVKFLFLTSSEAAGIMGYIYYIRVAPGLCDRVCFSVCSHVKCRGWIFVLNWDAELECSWHG